MTGLPVHKERIVVSQPQCDLTDHGGNQVANSGPHWVPILGQISVDVGDTSTLFSRDIEQACLFQAGRHSRFGRAALEGSFGNEEL